MQIPGNDRFTATNLPLRELIRFADDVQDVRLLGGPRAPLDVLVIDRVERPTPD